MGHPRSFYDAEPSFGFPGDVWPTFEVKSLRAPRKDHKHYGVEQLLLFNPSLDMNVTTDQELLGYFDFDGAETVFFLTRARAFNATLSLTTAQGTLYTGAGKTGALGSATQSFAALTGVSKGVDLTLNADATGAILLSNDMQFSL